MYYELKWPSGVVGSEVPFGGRPLGEVPLLTWARLLCDVPGVPFLCEWLGAAVCGVLTLAAAAVVMGAAWAWRACARGRGRGGGSGGAVGSGRGGPSFRARALVCVGALALAAWGAAWLGPSRAPG